MRAGASIRGAAALVDHRRSGRPGADRLAVEERFSAPVEPSPLQARPPGHDPGGETGEGAGEPEPGGAEHGAGQAAADDEPAADLVEERLAYPALHGEEQAMKRLESRSREPTRPGRG